MGEFNHEGDDDSSSVIIAGDLDRGLAYAECCFETFRAVDGAIFAWPAHVARLQRGLAEFGLSLTERQFAGIKSAALREAAAQGGDALFRVTVTGGDSGWGLMTKGENPAIYLQAMPGNRSVNPLMLRLKEWPFPPKPRPAKFSADYADTLRALQGEADSDVLFFHEGRLLGAATANLLLYRDGAWWTPRLDAGVLPGIVRAHLLEKGSIREAECPIGWLAESQAAALCNSGLFIRPVAGICGVDESELPFNPGHAALHTLADTLIGMAGIPQELF